MKWTTAAALLALTASISATAQEKSEPAPTPITVDAKTQERIRALVPDCGDEKYSFEEMHHTLPPNLTGAVVKIESPHAVCQGMFLSVTSAEGGFYLGLPWFLDGETGTPEERLKHFTFTHLGEIFTPIVGTTKTREGLYPVTLLQTTERGKLPLEGLIDPAGTVYFMGHFRPIGQDVRETRVASLEPYLGKSPVTGASKPVVTVIEFSDFECPSCKRASEYMKPILDRFPDKVRYIRYDLPLIASHPWSLAAAVAGRAIYRQKPALFWEYKKQVYSNQESLSAFTIGDFTRGFAQDHDLDLKRFDADVASEEIRNDLIKGAGVALSDDVRATPTYLVNGTMVDTGTEGKHLLDYVAGLLK